MKRRKFIQSTAGAGVILPSLIQGMNVQAFSSPLLDTLAAAGTESDKVLIIIMLNGGNDGINTVVPLDQYSQLSSARNNLLLNSSQVLSLNGYPATGLHPKMSGMQQLFNQGKVKIIQSVGYPSPDFSHFRSTDIWASGSDSNQYLSSGWVGRYLDYAFPGYPGSYPNSVMPDPLAVQIGYGLPLMFQGSQVNMAMTVSSAAIFDNWQNGAIDPLPPGRAGQQLEYIRMISGQTQNYAQNILSAYLNVPTQSPAWPAPGVNYLADQLKVISRVIAGGLKTRIYMATIGGFDTHASQADTSNTSQGTHGTLLGMLSEAVNALMADLQYLGTADRVVGLTFSEFGRRIMSNGSLGTDHGAAAPMFVFGNKVQGGILGTNPVIPSGVTPDDNLPMQFDYRSVYASVLKQWFCVPEPDLQTIMLNQFQELPVINSDCITGIINPEEAEKNVSISNSPNPFGQSTYIRFRTNGGKTVIQVFDMMGRMIKTPVDADMAAGEYTQYLENENWPSGNYYLRIQNGPFVKVWSMMIGR